MLNVDDFQRQPLQFSQLTAGSAFHHALKAFLNAAIFQPNQTLHPLEFFCHKIFTDPGMFYVVPIFVAKNFSINLLRGPLLLFNSECFATYLDSN